MLDENLTLKEFGKWLNQKFIDLGLERPSIEKATGISQATLSRIIAGKNRPLPETLEKLSSVINVSVDDLLTMSGYPTSGVRRDDTSVLLSKEDLALLQNPQIRAIARASKKLSETKQKLLIDLAESMAEEACKDAKNIRRARYTYVAEKAKDFIYKFNIGILPVDVHGIMSAIKTTIRTYQFYAKKHNCSVSDIIEAYGSEDGFTIYDEKTNTYSIAYNANMSSLGRRRFTVMHEIGHVYLKHLSEFERTRITRGGLSDDEYSTLETEANVFASTVLAPQEVLVDLNWVDVETIRNNCNLSSRAAQVKVNELTSGQYKIMPIKIRNDIKHAFTPFINQKYCPVCNYAGIVGTSKFCPICGNQKLKWKNRHRGMFYLEEELIVKYPKYELDKNSKLIKCPICDNENIAPDEMYCHICGTYLINKCADIRISYDDDEPGCGHLESGNARFCSLCGHPTTFFQNKLLVKWDDEDAAPEVISMRSLLKRR